MKIDITLRQFEILEDVLSGIEESRIYEDDRAVLDELKDKFSYGKYLKLSKKEKVNDMNEEMKSFEEAVKPIQKWLKGNCCPHDVVVIDWDMARLYEGKIGITSGWVDLDKMRESKGE